MASSMAVRPEQPAQQEQRRYYQVTRRFSGERHTREMVLNLLQAHSTD
jgi:hypothetical protein